MIKPRLRMYVCAAAVVVTLGGSVLSQAAGPGEFLSKLWKREPAPKKEVTPGFSPFRWLRGKKSDSTTGRIKVSDGGRTVISERPELFSDPFLAAAQTHAAEQSPATDQTPAVQQDHQRRPVTSTSRKIIVRPQQTPRPAPATTPKANAGSTGIAVQAERRPPTDRTPSEVARRDAASTQPAIATPPTGNGGFVDGFDNEFQKLVASVVAESRQKKQETATPKLPDDVGTDVSSPQLDALPQTTTADALEDRQQFADFAQERSRGSVSELIQESRRQMDSSILSQKADGQDSSRQTGSESSFADGSIVERNDVAAASHSRTNSAASPGADPSDSSFLPQRLPDQLGHNGKQLVVPSTIVPEGELFSPTEALRNRSRQQRREADAKADSAPPQPVVRVIPGSRGNGVVIESGQWSLIRPRVSSNVAPSRSVPDTSKFRRLSFEGAEGSTQNGAVLAVGEIGKNERNEETQPGQTGQSSFAPPALTIPPEGHSQQEIESNLPIMVPPDGRTESSMDAARLGEALAAAPAPPQMESTAWEWPDESEFAPVSPTGGVSWGTVVFCLLLTGGAASLFFRRKRQGGAFGITGTTNKLENS